MASQLFSLVASTMICLVSAFAIALLVITLYILGVVLSFAVFCIREFANRAQDRPPLIGTVFRQLKNFDRIFDEHVNRPCRVIEHVLKTNFSNYSKGAFNTEIANNLFGNGIFATDGEKWRHQRKLASHEFSTKVLRDFSSTVFRMNAAKLSEKISSAAASRITINMQVLP
ncbi:hypothetical protein BRADI_1g49871v3 [Brachypodium distachyon]|uniref:Cytochrome P450 n=1 Tax=Brachypodium distachyon TaxID=15368 RepID=A0A2K2DQM6_BRADI|nr:hypothetical protein BRADI_1g49871v3 [Brachypodium distachyon]